MTARHLLRLVALGAPSWLVVYALLVAPNPSALERTVAEVLGPLWVLVALGLFLRLVRANGDRRAEGALARVDLLTGRGAALGWLSALAFVGAVASGYASLAVVGMLGTALLLLAVLGALLAFRHEDPIRLAGLARSFEPALPREGDAVVERLHADGLRIPIGHRLFVAGRVGPRWATSRHVLGSVDDGGEIVLESEVGPAVRGDHEPEPLVAWLEDVLGLCRSARLPVPGPRLTVVPKGRRVENPALLLERGLGPNATRTTPRLPTEGSFDLREYRPGDDVRRIHWVRSAVAREVVVRLPDELPPDRPRVRVVLDTFFPESLALKGDAPAAVLDELVGVWLGVARALVAAGARVTLVSALPDQAAIERLPLGARDEAAALRLGSRVAWQSRTPVEALLTDEATLVVSRGILAPPPVSPRLRWVVVLPDVAPVTFRPASLFTFPHPSGSSENRLFRRRAAEDDRARRRTDDARAMLAFGTSAGAPPPGSFSAVPTPTGAFHLEAIS